METVNNPIYCNRCGFKSAIDAQFCQRCGESLQAAPLPAIAPFDSKQNHVIASGTMRTLTVRYAGFCIRAIASLLDVAVVFLAFLPVRILLGSTATLLGESWEMPTGKIFLMGRMFRIGFALVFGWLYRAGMESSSFQGTLGKLAVQIKVTDLDGSRISFERASGRYFAKFLSFIAFGVGYLMVGFTPRKQGLHDRIAGTLVQYR